MNRYFLNPGLPGGVVCVDCLRAVEVGAEACDVLDGMMGDDPVYVVVCGECGRKRED